MLSKYASSTNSLFWSTSASRADSTLSILLFESRRRLAIALRLPVSGLAPLLPVVGLAGEAFTLRVFDVCPLLWEDSGPFAFASWPSPTVIIAGAAVWMHNCMRPRTFSRDSNRNSFWLVKKQWIMSSFDAYTLCLKVGVNMVNCRKISNIPQT